MSKLAPLIESYLAGTATLRKAVAGMTPEQLKARPVPGKWSTLEVVCHISDFDPIYADRMKRVLADENPTLLGADEEKFAKALAYHSRDLEEEIKIVELTRSQMAKILRQLPDTALTRAGQHSERGPQTLEKLINGMINHVNHHVAFIIEKRKALGLAT